MSSNHAMASLPATLLLPLLGAVAVAQPGELNVNESSYTAPERVCFRILRSIEGGTKVSPVRSCRLADCSPADPCLRLLLRDMRP